MPTIDYNSQRYAEWINSHIERLGARLHPLGEVPTFNFFMEASGDIDEQRLQLYGVQIQIFLFVVMLYIFGCNLVIASKMVVLQPRNMVSWCCLIPSTFSIMASLLALFLYLGFPINCRILSWFSGFSLSSTMIGNSLILLQKAYLVIRRQNWIIFISIPIIAAQLVYGFIVVYYHFFTIEKKVGCMAYYPKVFVWYWFSINVPINLLFSAIFCRVAINQYRLFGSEAWRKLAIDGIQTMSSAALCSIICGFFIITFTDEINPDIFFVVDWVVVTTMLIRHSQNIGKNMNFAHHPKTSHMIRLSEIATARSVEY
ncbi:hypothetical protein BDF19DRAFT_326006 [Syncephalis fuscata]|nr:hypothetical protein BDF19DRAFT_326006 [Syncephalis fuscata]